MVMLVITRGYIPSNPIKPSFSYGFPMVFLWFSIGMWRRMAWFGLVLQLGGKAQPLMGRISSVSDRTKSSPQTAPLVPTRLFRATMPPASQKAKRKDVERCGQKVCICKCIYIYIYVLIDILIY